MFGILIGMLAVSCAQEPPDVGIEYDAWAQSGEYTVLARYDRTSDDGNEYLFTLIRGDTPAGEPMRFISDGMVYHAFDWNWYRPDETNRAEKAFSLTLNGTTATVISGCWKLTIDFSERSLATKREYRYDRFFAQQTTSDGRYEVGYYDATPDRHLVSYDVEAQRFCYLMNIALDSKEPFAWELDGANHLVYSDAGGERIIDLATGEEILAP